MRITIVLADARRVSASIPYNGAAHVTIAERCPHGCPPMAVAPGPGTGQRVGFEPLEVAGSGISHHDHDTYYAEAVALCCRRPIGKLEAKVSTIFGIDEDERVLNGRPRVY